MTALPAAGYISDSARTQDENKAAFEAWLAASREQPGADVLVTLTLASDACTPTRGVHAIDTEAAASSDNLATLDQASMPDGRLVWIRAATGGHAVVVKHAAGGAGQILLADSADLSLASTKQWLLLRRTGTSWEEVVRCYGDQLAALRAWLKVTGGVLAKSAAYTAVATDRGRTIDCTGTWTLGLTAAATLGSDWECAVRNSGAGVITIDPNASETIDGAATIALNPGDSCLVRGDGSTFRTVGRGLPSAGGTVQGPVTLAGGATAQGSVTLSAAAVNEAKAAAIASAGTTTIWAADGNSVHVTGTTTISSFGTAPQAGATRRVVFDGALTLVNGANLILPSGANVATAAGDCCEVLAETTTQHRVVSYTRANGTALVAPAPPAVPTIGKYDSGNRTITAGGTLSLSHGLGGVPDTVFCYLKCTSAELGYSVGDVALIGPNGSDPNNSMGAAVTITASQINVTFGSAGDAFKVIRKDNGGHAQITGTSWAFIVRAQRFS